MELEQNCIAIYCFFICYPVIKNETKKAASYRKQPFWSDVYILESNGVGKGKSVCFTVNSR